MPAHSPLRLIKRCRLYVPRGSRWEIPHVTRGIYILYCENTARSKGKVYEVFYIGAGGVSRRAKSGIGSRIKQHDKKKKEWTHYSFFEVHDNVSREEILELEGLFLLVFRYDRRVRLGNKQLGSTNLWRLSKKSSPAWRDCRRLAHPQDGFTA